MGIVSVKQQTLHDIFDVWFTFGFRSRLLKYHINYYPGTVFVIVCFAFQFWEGPHIY